ncbi:uncharacterized protein LOC127240622 [Andrographis paniculata]|uniref:uncharacterized protein LOC127240622 n=1 Tax=Andrographis paniculata TaxID=175694 RepID=UPI0021E99B69|nr:uncharacterized protein LOC127240622 [Andrographis paniculata]
MEKKAEDKKVNTEGLPIETSPYTQSKDVEDYKERGYGTRGHLTPKSGPPAAGSTDAPTRATTAAAADTTKLPEAELSTATDHPTLK